MINVFVCVKSDHEYACNMQTFNLHSFLVDNNNNNNNNQFFL